MTEADKLADLHEVRWHWNLLNYTECSKCKEDYVREFGWTFSRTDWLMTHGRVCKRCCATRAEAGIWAEQFQLAERDRRRMRAGKLPSPPPMRKIGSW